MVRHTLKVIQQIRGGSNTAATSSFQPLAVITKRSILDVAAALDPPLETLKKVLVCLMIWSVIHKKFELMNILLIRLNVDIIQFQCISRE